MGGSCSVPAAPQAVGAAPDPCSEPRVSPARFGTGRTSPLQLESIPRSISFSLLLFGCPPDHRGVAKRSPAVAGLIEADQGQFHHHPHHRWTPHSPFEQRLACSTTFCRLVVGIGVARSSGRRAGCWFRRSPVCPGHHHVVSLLVSAALSEAAIQVNSCSRLKFPSSDKMIGLEPADVEDMSRLAPRP